MLLTRHAVTNKGEDYENIYGMFYEVADGRIQTQVELLDFRVAADKFDLSALERADDCDVNEDDARPASTRE